MSGSGRPFSMRLGLREYSITPEEFLDPGGLVDSVIDDEICKTGGFIGRLETWTLDDGMRNVEEVKRFIKEESSRDLFHPEWLKRKSLCHRILYNINPIHDQSVEGENAKECARDLVSLRRLQSTMRKNVDECDFAPEGHSGELSQLLATESIFHVADAVLDNLENLGNEVVYLQNMLVFPPLETCGGLAMTSMNTGLQKLSNKPIAGIQKPTVYIGTEFSTFPCHREDMSFLAINRHIAGAPKIWFCVPPAYYDAFIWMLRNHPIPDAQKGLVCQLLHKYLWICPKRVVECGIPVYSIVQRPGDIVYLMPNTIHWGLNVDFNMNEAVNFACKAWVVPAMLSHQRCKCNKHWACRFEIRDVLVSHGASAHHLKSWSSRETFGIAMDLKASQPLLFTRYKDVYEHGLDDESMSVGIVKALPASSMGEDGAGAPDYPQCTLCSFCPKRCRSDAYDRIKAHAYRCHGPEHADEVTALARERFENFKQKQKEEKTFKCPAIKCPRCNKTVHGNQTRLTEHQSSRNCKRPQNEVEEDVHNPDSSSAGPSSRSATKRGRMSSRKK